MQISIDTPATAAANSGIEHVVNLVENIDITGAVKSLKECMPGSEFGAIEFLGLQAPIFNTGTALGDLHTAVGTAVTNFEQAELTARMQAEN